VVRDAKVRRLSKKKEAADIMRKTLRLALAEGAGRLGADV